MHRRINHAVEFKVPNLRLRYSIWKAHLPETVSLDKDVNLEDLAIRFELSGGIKKKKKETNKNKKKKRKEKLMVMQDLLKTRLSLHSLLL